MVGTAYITSLQAPDLQGKLQWDWGQGATRGNPRGAYSSNEISKLSSVRHDIQRAAGSESVITSPGPDTRLSCSHQTGEWPA